MSNREGKDTEYFLEKRRIASNNVKIRFFDDIHFDVIDEDNSAKYSGKIDLQNSIEDDCSCPSFQFGMQYEKLGEDGKKGKSQYLEYHGTAFQCKHVIRAKTLRKLGLYDNITLTKSNHSSESFRIVGDCHTPTQTAVPAIRTKGGSQ